MSSLKDAAKILDLYLGSMFSPEYPRNQPKRDKSRGKSATRTAQQKISELFGRVARTKNLEIFRAPIASPKDSRISENLESLGNP